MLPRASPPRGAGQGSPGGQGRGLGCGGAGVQGCRSAGGKVELTFLQVHAWLPGRSPLESRGGGDANPCAGGLALQALRRPVDQAWTCHEASAPAGGLQSLLGSRGRGGRLGVGAGGEHRTLQPSGSMSQALCKDVLVLSAAVGLAKASGLSAGT